MAEEAVRLQKFLAAAGVCSRREAEGLIESGKVYVNGRKAALGQKVFPSADVIKVKGKSIDKPEPVIFLFHKPRGFLCNNDGRRPEQSLFVEFPEIKPYRVVIGLDMTASGLILLSNDGVLLQRVASQQKGIERRFQVRVKGVIAEKTQERLKRGVNVAKSLYSLSKIKELKKDGERTWYEVVMRGTKDKSLEKLFKAVQHPLQRVVQVEIAGLQDGTLKKGKGRVLTAKEQAHLHTLFGSENSTES